jgi:hypothetical protein
MHVVRRRIAAQHVVVDGRDIDPVLDQLGHDRIDFGVEQHQVAHDHRPAVRRLERRPAAQRQGRPNVDAIKCYGQVAARKPVAVNVAGDRGAPADRFIDFLPVDLLGAGGTRANYDNRTSRKHVSSTHHHVLLDWVHCFVLLPNPRPFVI